MSVRRLEKSDYHKNYLGLLNQLKPIEMFDFNKFSSIFDNISKNKNHVIFVIEEDNIIVGTITVLMEEKFIYGGQKLGHIEDFVVDSKYRKCGYGSKLLEHSILFCKNNNCRKVGLCSRANAVDFYYKKGLDVIGNYFAKYL